MLALYSEKKAAANKGLRNKNVDFFMLEERIYGDSAVSDATKARRMKDFLHD